MATPAIATVVAAQKANTLGEAAIKVATTPIVSRRTIKESEDRNGEPVLVESQVNITPAAVVAGAFGAFILGLGLGVGRDASGKARVGVVQRPRSLLPFAGQVQGESAPQNGGVAQTVGEVVLFSPFVSKLKFLFGR